MEGETSDARAGDIRFRRSRLLFPGSLAVSAWKISATDNTFVFWRLEITSMKEVALFPNGSPCRTTPRLYIADWAARDRYGSTG
jgi:hypothetical protein